MKFSIRDLLLVTVIVAILMGWWLDRSFLADKVNIQDDQIFRLRHQESIWLKIRTKLQTTADPLADGGTTSLVFSDPATQTADPPGN